MTKHIARRIKLLAALLALGPVVFQFSCTSAQVQAALSSGVETVLNALFDNFAEGVSDSITGNQS